MKKQLLQLFITAITVIGFQTIGRSGTLYTPGLKVTSFLTYKGERVDNYTIIIYKNGIGVDTIAVGVDNTVKFRLDFDADYCVRYIKKGYYDRIVMVNTRLPETNRDDYYKFDFEIEMISDDGAPNTLADMPVALVQYDKEKDDFMNDRDYFRQIRGKDLKESEE